MVSHKAASEVPVTTATSTGVDFPTDTKIMPSDIKAADAEQNNARGSAPGELKRQLKSRHLQMIAIGMLRFGICFFGRLLMPGFRWNNWNG